MKKVSCAKCGKPEMVSEEKAAKVLPYEEAERKLVQGECAVVHLCEGCEEALKEFRKTSQN